MPASKRATEETSKTATKPAVGVTVKGAAKVTAKPGGKANIKTVSKVAEEATPVPADISEHASATRPVATSTRKPSKTALSPSEVTPLALLTPSKPARRRRSGAAKPRKLKGATTTWPFPTGSRP